MRNINKVYLIGRLGSDPSVRQGKKTEVATLRIATNRAWAPRGKEHSGERNEETEWHTVVVFGKQWLYPSLIKGSLVFVEGRLHYRNYERDGDIRYVTEIIAETVIPLGSSQSPEAQETQSEYVPAYDENQDQDIVPF